MSHPAYEILLSWETLETIERYKEELLSGKTPGFLLSKEISLMPREMTLRNITIAQFIQMLLATKKIVCFAEQDIEGNGKDWNDTELTILGDSIVAMTVTVYDNGVWNPKDKSFRGHEPPILANLLFIPGPLLQGDRFRGPTPDFKEVTCNGKIDETKYTKLIKRRVLPALIFASDDARNKYKKALVTLPGIGCGAFAGRFRGRIGDYLSKALQTILTENGQHLQNIACVRFDPFLECEDREEIIQNIKYRVRKNVGPLGKPQLSSLVEFEENNDEFNSCNLYKIVAWDHASLPGNDFFMGCRDTDDGVSAAATNSMEVITNFTGRYVNGYYLPPKEKQTWGSVAEEQNTRLIVDRNIRIASPDGTCVLLDQFERGS